MEDSKKSSAAEEQIIYLAFCELFRGDEYKMDEEKAQNTYDMICISLGIESTAIRT